VGRGGFGAEHRNGGNKGLFREALQAVPHVKYKITRGKDEGMVIVALQSH
jgi:hypothetical protein